MPELDLFDVFTREIDDARLIKLSGRVIQVTGLMAESRGPDVRVGDLCRISFRGAEGSVDAEVVGFRDERVFLMPLGDLRQVGPGCCVAALGRPLGVHVGEAMLGRVLNSLGRPIDDAGPLVGDGFYPLHADPPHPLRRQQITTPLSVGVRSIDGFLTLGRGQRIGIFSGSGVGKSTLLGMMARNTEADVNVIALVGERGREVREFIDKDLGAEGLKRSVVVVATSDQPPLVRLKASLSATAIAEYFRDRDCNVLLLMDSLTRVARAQREIGLAVGEPPATRGYPPSVFELLPRLLERAGAGERGSITGVYTVLAEGDDLNEPVSDAVRAVLDGHIVLSRRLAARNFYPAVDLSESVSRVMPSVVSASHMESAAVLRAKLAAYRDAEDLINIGAYKSGANADVDWMLDNRQSFESFMKQGIKESSSFAATEERLTSLAAGAASV